MAKAVFRTVLFIAEDTRGSQAVTHFQTAAGRMGLPWKAMTRPAPEPADRTISFIAPAEGIAHWTAADGPSIEREVMGLIAELLGGSRGPDPAPPTSAPEPTAAKKAATVKVGRETKGRRGKGVTLVWELPLSETQLQELATTLKNKCGTGGTVKDGVIEIQGDQRDRITVELEKLGYKVKRVGG